MLARRDRKESRVRRGFKGCKEFGDWRERRVSPVRRERPDLRVPQVLRVLKGRRELSAQREPPARKVRRVRQESRELMALPAHKVPRVRRDCKD